MRKLVALSMSNLLEHWKLLLEDQKYRASKINKEEGSKTVEMNYYRGLLICLDKRNRKNNFFYSSTFPIPLVEINQ